MHVSESMYMIKSLNVNVEVGGRNTINIQVCDWDPSHVL